MYSTEKIWGSTFRFYLQIKLNSLQMGTSLVPDFVFSQNNCQQEETFPDRLKLREGPATTLC